MHIGHGINENWNEGMLSWLFLLIDCFCLWALVFLTLVELCLYYVLCGFDLLGKNPQSNLWIRILLKVC